MPSIGLQLRLSPPRRRAAARFLLAALGSLALGAGPLAPGQEQPPPRPEQSLPKAQEILEKYIAATGGKAEYAKINNRVLKGTFEVPAQGAKGSITIYAARPNLLVQEVELPGIGKQEAGTDGQVVWQRSPMTGAQLVEGQPREEFLRNAIFDSDIAWDQLYKKAETVGVEDVEGKPAYKVELTISDENKLAAFYDKQSHLLTKLEVTADTPMGPIPTETFVEDYKKVGGILYAHRHRQRMKLPMMVMEQLLTFDSVELNANLDKSRFALPEDVKELLKKQNEAKTDKP